MTRTPADRLLTHAEAAFREAGYAYAEVTESPGSDRAEPLYLGARLRLAAKAMLAARRAAVESHGSRPGARRGPVEDGAPGSDEATPCPRRADAAESDG
jgi:hypothetical protein